MIGQGFSTRMIAEVHKTKHDDTFAFHSGFQSVIKIIVWKLQKFFHGEL